MSTSSSPSVARVWVDLTPDPKNPQKMIVVVSQDPVFVQPGTAILFESPHPIGLLFTDGSPMVGPFRDHTSGLPEDWPGDFEPRTEYWLGEFIREDGARTEAYKYTVAVTGEDRRVHIVDPELVVEMDPKARDSG